MKIGLIKKLAKESTMRDLAEEYIAADIVPRAAWWGDVMKMDKEKGEKVFDPALLPKLSVSQIENEVQKVFGPYTRKE